CARDLDYWELFSGSLDYW
nr:immunoglobulin heavy chain junction region [Macaca mulatta]